MQLIGLLGYPLAHSHSPAMINQLARLNQWPISYHPFAIQQKDLKKFVESVILLAVKGFNVTIPYKGSILAYCDKCSPDVQAVSAANTIVNHNGVLSAFNTDVFGFEAGMADFNVRISDITQSLILGAGGAARSAAYVLAKSGCKNLEIVTRDRKREEEWRSDFPAIFELARVSFCRFGSNDFVEKTGESQLVVQSTPVGTFPEIEDVLDFPFGSLNKDAFVFDMIYNPEKTRFMSLAEQQGAKVQNGLTMLAAQAVKSLEIWGFKTSIEDLREILRQILQDKAE